MRKIILVMMLLGICPAMGRILEYEFAGTIDKAVRGSYEIDADSFSGGFTFDSGSGWFSGGDGVKNYRFDDFYVTISGSSHEWNYPSAMFTRRQVQVRNRATENSDSISFFADNFGPPNYWPTVQYRVELKDYDKTVFTDDTLPQSLNLSNFEVRSFRGHDYSLQFEGTITSLIFIPEPTTILPFAVAGPNQTVYAYPDGFADVTLDGSDSNDPDGDDLTYQWVWTIKDITYDTNTVNPIIELPVGEHIITLVVNDGSADSEPDYVTITVIEPVESLLRIYPRTLNRTSRGRYIIAFMRLPEGITKDQIANEKVTLYPGDIPASRQFTMRRFINGAEQVIILALFDRSALTNAIPENGRTELEVTGRLTTGQIFYGTDFIRIINPKNKPRPNANRYRRRRR